LSSFNRMTLTEFINFAEIEPFICHQLSLAELQL
jgi:hypothetical protein